MENELQKFIDQYSLRYGAGTGEEIAGGLMFSHGISGILQVFKKAKGRKIVLEHPEDIIDGVIVKYVKIKPNEKT